MPVKAEYKVTRLPPAYYSEHDHPDLIGLPSLRGVTEFTQTMQAYTRICDSCNEMVNACTANFCMGCGRAFGKKPGTGWHRGNPDAYTG